MLIRMHNIKGSGIMDSKFDNKDNFEYTIVMDASYMGPQVNADDAQSGSAEEAEGHKEIDRLYNDYERMALRVPTVVDTDDAYPRSYQWRVGDRYDPAKVKVIEAALKERVKIADTEAYKQYIEDITSRKFKPESWD